MATYITFVLDETGSMFTLKDETITSFNIYLNTLQDTLKGHTHFSLLLFNSARMNWCYNDMKIRDVPELNNDSYVPEALTPLWDAIAEAIIHMEKQVKGKKNSKVIITILTDGYENMSKKYLTDDVRKMIESHKDWAFNFLGANIDTWFVSRRLGISINSSSNFDFSPDGILSATKSAAIGTQSFVDGKTTADTFYEGKEFISEYKGKTS